METFRVLKTDDLLKAVKIQGIKTIISEPCLIPEEECPLREKGKNRKPADCPICINEKTGDYPRMKQWFEIGLRVGNVSFVSSNEGILLITEDKRLQVEARPATYSYRRETPCIFIIRNIPPDELETE